MKLFRLLFCCLLISGCKHEKDFDYKNTQSIKLNLEENTPSTLKTSGNYEIVSLETNADVFIGQLSKLFASDKYFIVFDKTTQSIFVFDNKGKFLNKIGRKGEKKGEFKEITDMEYYDDTDIIEIYSIPERKFLRFKVNGELITEQKLKFDFLSFYKVKEGYWVYGCFSSNKKQSFYNLRGNTNNLLLLSENMMSIKGAFCESKNFFDRVNSNDNFQKNDKGELFFHYGYSDMIYKLEGEKAKPFLFLNFGKSRLPYDSVVNFTNNKDFDNTVFLSRVKHDGLKHNMQIGNRLITFECTKYGMGNLQSYVVTCFLDKLSYKVFTNNQLSDIGNFFTPICIKNNKVIYSINSHLLTPENVFNIKKTYHINVNTNSNPLLVTTNEKDFN
jgi:hypothetical protein